MKLRSLLACVLAAMVGTACDQSFVPIQPSDLQFSVFGYLDAAADTQWIRVSPLRSTILTAPGSLGATVSLEELGTGRTIVLRDSLFRFSANPEVGSDGVYLHNFWTTETIEPGATYRFSAALDAEEPSEAVVLVPPDYLAEVWLAQQPHVDNNVLRLVGLRHVAFLEVVTSFYDTCGSGIKRLSFIAASTDSDVQTVPIPRQNVTREGCTQPAVEKSELLVVGSGEKWPSGAKFSASGLGASNVPSNISNSVGYLGGVLTKLVPYESCRLEGADPTTERYCKLRYDEAAATLTGTLRDVLCTGEGVTAATMELRKIDAEPSGSRKVRFTNSNRSGGYRIGALEAGAYAVSVRGSMATEYDRYVEYTDTIEFAAGELRTYDVGLKRYACPPQ